MSGFEHNALTIVQSRALVPLFSKIRDASLSSSDFVFYSKRLMRILSEEALSMIYTTQCTVTTPCGAYEGLAIDAPEASMCVVSIIRAGDSLLEAMREIMPSLAVGKILIQVSD
jgi:uracil phosphoribosyltransferase